MQMIAIQAQVKTFTGDAQSGYWSGSRQIPLFYLNPAIQGITDTNSAIKIATQILNPMNNPYLGFEIDVESIQFPGG